MINGINLTRRLGELEERLKHTPEPAYTFAIGDKVRVSNLEDAVVEEVLHDGKIYLIEYTKVNKQYGQPVTSERQKNYYNWLQVRKHIEEPQVSFISNTDFNPLFTYTRLTDILNKIYDFGMKFDRDYQQEYTWELNDKISLIDSIFSNVDIGKFVCIQNDTKTWVKTSFGFEILDGKQRLTAITEYYEDRFEWNGRKFSDLSSRDQNYFVNYHVPIAEVKGLTREKILKYYLLLNTFGKAIRKNS